MKILVLGNGFDLAHDLPTRYLDFLDFAKLYVNHRKGMVYKKEELEEYSEGIRQHIVPLISDFKEKCVGLICEDESEHSLVQKKLETGLKHNMWIEYFSKIRDLRGWAGFEGEISKVIQCLEDVQKKKKRYNNATQQNEFLIEYTVFPFMRTFFGDAPRSTSRSYHENGFKNVCVK